MKVALVLLFVAGVFACERANDASPTVPSPSPPTPAPADAAPVPVAEPAAAIERLRAELASLTGDDCVYLAELGCFSLKRYAAYEGQSPLTGEPVQVPEKTLPFFRPDRALTQVIAGETPAPDDAETHAWKAKVHRPWADALAKQTRERLLAQRVADLPSIGTLRIQRRESTGDLGVTFEASPFAAY